MPRNITVTFDDGSSHVYQNAPDGVSPAEVQDRAQTEFGKAVTALDGGRGGPLQQTQGAGSEVLRQLGLTARAGVKGVLSLPAAVADGASGLVNTGLDLVSGKGNGFRFQTTSSALDDLLTRAGLPAPKNAAERVVQDVAGAGAAGAGSVGAGKVLQQAAGPIIQAVGDVFAAAPGSQILAGASSGGAQGLTREAGGSETAQAIAGLTGAATPTGLRTGLEAGTKQLLRGGEQGRLRVAENIKQFKDAADIVPSVGQATEGRGVRALESVLAKTPGSAGVFSRSAQQKTDAIAASVNKLAAEMAPGGSAINAGEAITKGVQGFKEGFKTIQQRLYDTLDLHIPPGTPIKVGNTQAALAELNADIPGAANLSEFFKNAKIQGIDRALQADLEKAAGGALPYEAVKKLRTLVGNEIADNSILSDVPRSKWSALYAALSEDLGGAAKAAGPKAELSWQWANQFTKSQLERLEQLSGIVGKDAPEKVFSAAMSGTSEGNTVLKRVVDAIPNENRRELAAAVLRRMGRASAGNQNEVGDVFSTETFLTNLNKLAPESRNVLVSRLGLPQAPNKLAQLAGVAANVREGSKVFANPSGTGQVVSAMAPVYTALGALASGHPVVAGAALAAPVAANRLAVMLTSPGAVRALAEKTQLNPTVAPSQINALGRWLGVTEGTDPR